MKSKITTNQTLEIKFVEKNIQVFSTMKNKFTNTSNLNDFDIYNKLKSLNQLYLKHLQMKKKMLNYFLYIQY